jgi:hypothetical protein
LLAYLWSTPPLVQTSTTNQADSLSQSWAHFELSSKNSPNLPLIWAQSATFFPATCTTLCVRPCHRAECNERQNYTTSRVVNKHLFILGSAKSTQWNLNKRLCYASSDRVLVWLLIGVFSQRVVA